MKTPAFALLVPSMLLLSACTTVQPVTHDNGTRTAPCVSGGPDSVAQQFYQLRLEHPSLGLPDSTQLAAWRPYLSEQLYQSLLQANRQSPAKTDRWRSSDLFSSQPQTPTSASVDDSSTIPNRDARNIPLRVTLQHNDLRWQDEVLMIHEGQCWVVDDIRYLGHSPHAGGGSLQQLLEQSRE